MTLFEQCAAAAEAVDLIDDHGEWNLRPDDARAITRAVLTTLRTHTASLRTAEEIDRVLAEGV